MSQNKAHDQKRKELKQVKLTFDAEGPKEFINEKRLKPNLFCLILKKKDQVFKHQVC
jgi:hypothetical protein